MGGDAELAYLISESRVGVAEEAIHVLLVRMEVGQG